MKTAGLPKPINGTQEQFHKLCELGGGQKGGPARPKVQQLLKESGQSLNMMAYSETAEHLKEHSKFNPWHVCFAIGLSWGHLAKLDLEFTGAAVRCLENWNDDDLALAKSFHVERGPEPIEHSLIGGYTLFQKVKLPDGLPDNLIQIGRAQERWFSPIQSKDRPRYIGSWNATAMFMVALFAQPHLAKTLTEPVVSLPPGGPIFMALHLLYRTHVLNSPPAGSELDDEAFEPASIFLNNSLFAEIRKGLEGWSLIDVHSGLYMLGTRYLPSKNWF